jgi:hypothetical protein
LVVVALATPKLRHAPNVQPSFGYSCEVASGTGCSLRPCVKYAQSLTSPPGDVVVATSAITGGCSSTAKATPRAIAIAAP